MCDTLEKFYKENREMYLKRLYYRAGSPENAEDILQEAFCRAIRYWDSFNPNAQELGAWFNTVLNNALRNFKVDEKHMGTYVEYDDELTDGAEMSQTDGDMVERIEAEVAKYGGVSKDALYLYCIKGYRPREVRQVLDIKKFDLSNLIKTFKSNMRDKYGDD